MNKKTYVKLSLMILCVISLFSFAWAQDGILSFETDSTTVNVGDTFDVRIKLNTGTHSVGVIQVRANFDDTLLSITAGDVTVDTVTWSLPSPEPPNVTGNLIKFTAGVAGLGVSGTDILVATLNFTCTGAGDGNITFVGGADPINSTMALDSTTFTNILGTFNDIIITQTPPSTQFDFDVDTEGWQYSGAVPPYTAPTGTHNTADGTLDILATNNTDNFGFWYSPMDAIPELAADNLYRIRFGVKSDQVDKSVVPSFRVRFNSSNFKQGDFVMVNSNDAGEASPDSSVIDYDLYMRPQADALLPDVTGLLSFDMLNLNPNDSASATISLDYVQVDKKSVDDLGTSTTVQPPYTFAASEEGWTSSPAIAPYDAPIFTYDDIEGFLAMQCDDNNNTYGFWENTQDEIALDNAVLYQLRVKAGTDANAKLLQDEPPLMRIRMYDHPSNQMIKLYQTPVWTPFEEPPASKLSQIIFADHYVYFHNSLGIGPYLGIAVDIVNLDPDESPSGIVAVTEVELLSFPIPSF